MTNPEGITKMIRQRQKAQQQDTNEPTELQKCVKALQKLHQKEVEARAKVKPVVYGNNNPPVMPHIKPYVDPTPVIKHANDATPVIPESWKKRKP